MPDSSKPQDTDFRQQRLRAWQPLLTPTYVISTFAITGLIFVIIGIVILVTSRDVVELEMQYSEDSPNPVLEFPITQKMSKPVYVYYKLTNFYQNHRRYVKSRSDTQLAGKSGSLSTCDPLETYPDPDDGNAIKTLYPCGLVANSFFNDNFVAKYQPPGGGPDEDLDIDPTDIAWSTDRKTKFKELYPDDNLPADLSRNGPHGEMPKLNDERFIVWMRSAGLPTFKKLYGKIDQDLEKGSVLKITVDKNEFKVAAFGGTKAVVVSTASWLGGKNNFLGLAYVIVGGVCLLLAIIFKIKAPRELGAIAYFKAKARS